MSSVLRFKTHSGEETQAVGRQIAQLLPGRGVVLLIGNLGAGKTTLTKGIVEERGAAKADEVSSPTFTLIHEYGNPVRIYHVDLYRLETIEQVQRLGLDELMDSAALVLVEWGERFSTWFPEQRIEIRFTNIGGDNRKIEISGLNTTEKRKRVGNAI
ncbi:MAG: tRNA (adenosine(37)-N6)-threonylcarbamoyltransferase complex ATPase subunit type 1 TsaE [Acidobacteriaceae bacterium]|nr:tRNA (adenosine(37)-N6)-threonylcarbamoyltransferase complex ATPase subunit type 1 TsaE [Acidobacteriaceae bacterium]MBV9502966.1 tRNA (adenosine(37)-N6)-threonylcarbamoyltransferase complex ATPase subunit type 1 TsaE [Acidobacteriaceae bacterium]